MKPDLLTFGEAPTRVVVIDDFSQRRHDLVEMASAMAPFVPSDTSFYPGLRRYITAADGPAFAYVEDTLQQVAPFIGGAFDIDSFTWDEASFSLVTTPPLSLAPRQRGPHFDSTDPGYIAILHYLGDTPGSGTAFYRHRATGIERIDDGNVRTFVATAMAENAATTAEWGYIGASNAYYDQIGFVAAVPDRLIIYPGCCLHSAVIAPDMALSDDPARGRLTANLFVSAA